MNRGTLVLVALLAPAFTGAAAAADRVQVFSIQGADCGSCGDKIKKALKPVKGVRKAEFDIHKVELTVRLRDGVSDDAVVAAVAAVGFKAIPGAGQGGYTPTVGFPAGADVTLMSPDGRAVGSLEKQRVDGKYTVYDVYADWCGPCRLVEARLREILARRSDIAVRRLNVVDFDTPLASELGPDFQSLPYLIVFTPKGKRIDIHGADFERLDKALARP
jgi:copper chaperone CopZ